MPTVKIKKPEGENEVEKLPLNYNEFFEKKAAEAKAFLEKHPIPEHLFQKK